MYRVLLVLALLLPGVSATAQQPAPPPQTAPPAEDGGRRHIKGYFGWQTDGATDFVLGAEFVWHQGRRFGLSGFTEAIFADDFRLAIGATAQLHLRNRLYFEAGPGFAFDGGSDFFWRVGAGYELSLGLTITPKLHLDFIDGETVLGYGLAIGRRW
jgi:hypothetical protein